MFNGFTRKKNPPAGLRLERPTSVAGEVDRVDPQGWKDRPWFEFMIERHACCGERVWKGNGGGGQRGRCGQTRLKWTLQSGHGGQLITQMGPKARFGPSNFSESPKV